MKVSNAVEVVQKALDCPVQTWLDYSPKSFPLVIYDDNEFVLINHPAPPYERPEQLTAATAAEINDTCGHV
jgi:hypothetical protein